MKRKLIKKALGGPSLTNPITLTQLSMGPGSFLQRGMDQPDVAPFDSTTFDTISRSYGPYINSITANKENPIQVTGGHYHIRTKDKKHYYITPEQWDKYYGNMGKPTNTYALGGAVIGLGQQAGGLLGDFAASMPDDTLRQAQGKAFLKNAAFGVPGMIKGLFDARNVAKEFQAKEREMLGNQGQNMKYDNTYMPTFPMGGLIPYGEPNVELEKQEVMQGPDGSMVTMDAPSHAQGGIQLNAQPGSRVFSDRLKPKGSDKTYAEMADEIRKQIAKYEKMLS